MVIYNFPVHGKKYRAIRLIGWGTVALLIGVLFLSTWPPSLMTDQTSRTLGLSTMILGAVVIFALTFLTGRSRYRTIQETIQYEISDLTIAQRCQGQVVVEFPLAKIATITERSGWVIIRSEEPVEQIAIPKEIEGFGDLKSILGKYREIIPSTPVSRAGVAIRSVVASIAMVLLFTTGNRAVIVTAASTVLLFQVLVFFQYLRIWKKVSGTIHTRIVLVLVAVVLFWLSTGWILHIRGIIG